MKIGSDGGREDPALPNDNAPFATLPVRPTDRVVRAGCLALAALWQALGLREAAGTMRHYLSATGAPYRIDADRILALPPVHRAVDTQLSRWLTEAPELPGTYEADSTWRGVLINRTADTDLWLALRGIQYRLTGTVRVTERGPTVAAYRFHVHKSWNFDRGENEYGIPFTPFARLHETGLAREFTVTGETSPVTARASVEAGDH
ncbi:hypothetical protein [Streptomyces sp. NBC_01465]|uniref:hypothetical protein n=1 Tax=Streptomyces sp. NBC_01465 TaxID=2903878 RepID=UPI002E3439F5|nr:hypothetical protein [Streptomyces sp. NBC_01465]